MSDKNKKVWRYADEAMKKEIMDFSVGYIEFLNSCKTEREAVSVIVEMAEKAGFKNINDVEKLQTGSKVYGINRNKSVYVAVIGEEELTTGINCVGSHIDAPRLDLKPNPLYEDGEMALFKTHYYGGIKKYQWTTVPLALHGVIAKTDGTVVDVNIGEDEDDPVFLITDLLPHLSGKQNEKKLSEGVTAENLNIVVGSMPMEDEKGKSNVKAHILSILKEKYGIIEEDFRSAEIEAVPAAKAKSLGFDRSMVAGYGQDDRVCAYTSLMGILEMKPAKKTALCIFADKEEIGSVGSTGMYSNTFELFLINLLEKSGIESPYGLRKTLCASKALSADVTAAYDPTFSEVMEKYNSSYIGKGISVKKYTGARGKSGASDANAEFVGEIRGLFERNGVDYQFSEMGKVDEGGGGTIAYILANRGMEVLDCGVPIHSMHSPYESAGKYDIYMAYKAYKAFMECK